MISYMIGGMLFLLSAGAVIYNHQWMTLPCTDSLSCTVFTALPYCFAAGLAMIGIAMIHAATRPVVM